MSVDALGGQADRYSSQASVSANGRYVVFVSGASNLVPGDTNGHNDVFVKDLRTGAVERVSIDSFGVQSNDDSNDPSISADGRFVVFDSWATNLVPNDTNATPDVFVVDRLAKTIERVSVSSSGTEGNGGGSHAACDASGRLVVFYSNSSNLVPFDTNNRSDIFLHDRATHTTTRVSLASTEANDSSQEPDISSSGRFVAFTSAATNLVPGDTNRKVDTFVKDLVTGTVLRASVDSNGSEADDYSGHPSLSGSGGRVTFSSWAQNLVPGDTNHNQDVFVHDLALGTTWRLSVDANGIEGRGFSGEPCLSDDGEWVTFSSNAPNLVPQDRNRDFDVFLVPVLGGSIERVSVATDGTEGDDGSFGAVPTADASTVVFSSTATNLVAADTNAYQDVFTRGSELTLETSAAAVQAGDTLELATWLGTAPNLAGIWLVGIDSNPLFQRLALGPFGIDGVFSLSGVVPPGLGTFTATFLSVGVADSGRLVVTAPVEVEFQ